MTPTNKELAALLISAASALNHGRQTTARTKIAQVYKALHPPIEGNATIAFDSTIQTLLLAHRPIIPGQDQFGAFLMFDQFRSAMPSTHVAHVISHLLNDGRSYCGQPGCPCGPVDPPHEADSTSHES